MCRYGNVDPKEWSTSSNEDESSNKDESSNEDNNSLNDSDDELIQII